MTSGHTTACSIRVVSDATTRDARRDQPSLQLFPYDALMSDNADQFTPEPTTSAKSLDDLRSLVTQAYEKALETGRSDWEEMTAAVLKNRLLDITRRDFSEAQYGSSTFLELIRRIPDTVEIKGDSPPYSVRIRSSGLESIRSRQDTASESSRSSETSAPIPNHRARRYRVRHDLWCAIIDYQSGKEYVFDPTTGSARPRNPDDRALPTLPTASPAELTAWRGEFAEEISAKIDYSSQRQVREWAVSTGRLKDLPESLRGEWALYLKEAVVARLEQWFRERAQNPPANMLVEAQSTRTSKSGSDYEERKRQLREVIIRAVRMMTFEELSGISLPASIVVRLTSSGAASHDNT
jgi:hypothetical protein